jgi:hypothetical protein
MNNTTHKIRIHDTPDVSLGNAHESIFNIYQHENFDDVFCFDMSLKIIDESQISGSADAFTGSFESCNKYSKMLTETYGMINQVLSI